MSCLFLVVIFAETNVFMVIYNKDMPQADKTTRSYLADGRQKFLLYGFLELWSLHGKKGPFRLHFHVMNHGTCFIVISICYFLLKTLSCRNWLFLVIAEDVQIVVIIDFYLQFLVLLLDLKFDIYVSALHMEY